MIRLGLPRFPQLLAVADARWRDSSSAVIGVRIAVGFPDDGVRRGDDGAPAVCSEQPRRDRVDALLNGALTFALLALGYHVRAVVAASTVDLARELRRATPGRRGGRSPSCGCARPRSAAHSSAT